ncbi:MAG TPA: VOC family protein [Vicinamibacterales bacterium]|jgi:PhnB protein
MIARLWKGRASGEGAEVYRVHVTTTILPELRRLGGFLRGRVFQRKLDGQTEFLVMTEWTDENAIRAFAGDDIGRAVVEPAARACLSDFDDHVAHFELTHDDRDARSQASQGAQGVIPMIAYENGVGALEWLSRAFGFVERARLVQDGRLAHGEMETGAGLIMLATPTPAYEGPRRHRETCQAAREWSKVPWVVDGLLVFVDDVEAHLERARRAGAVVLSEIETDGPGPRYRVEDVEGHRWMFMQRPPAAR